MSFLLRLWDKIFYKGKELMADPNQITENFKITEFACKDGTPYPREWIDERLKPLCDALEIIRSECGDKSVRITSGFRTPVYNRRIRGAKKSQHLVGRAADIVVKDVNPRTVAKIIRRLINRKKIPKGGVGDYSGFTHYDCRGYNARWKGK